MALYWACSSISRNDYVIFCQTSSSADVSITFFLFLTLLLLIGPLLFASRRQLERSLRTRKAPLLAISAAASIALVQMLYMHPSTGSAYWPLRIASCSILVAWYLLATFSWGMVAVGMGAKHGALAVVVSYLLSCFVSVLYLLPSPVCDIVEIGTPLLTALFWMRCQGSLAKANFSAGSANTADPPNAMTTGSYPDDVAFDLASLKHFPVAAVVMCGIFYWAAGTTRDYVSYENFETIGYFQSVVPLIVNAGSAFILLVAFLIGFRKQTTWQSFYNALVVAIIFFFACLFGVMLGLTPASKGGEQLISASYMCFKVLLWVFIVVVSCDLGVSVTMTFSVFFVAVAALFMFVVGTVFPLFTHLVGLDIYANREAPLLVMAFILISTSMVFMLHYMSTNERGVVESAKMTSHHDALSAIADEHKLTQRETDVATLVLQGYSLKMIAEVLYISEGTVQTHMKNLYRKLGLHSKREFIVLVRSREDATGATGDDVE